MRDCNFFNVCVLFFRGTFFSANTTSSNSTVSTPVFHFTVQVQVFLYRDRGSPDYHGLYASCVLRHISHPSKLNSALLHKNISKIFGAEAPVNRQEVSSALKRSCYSNRLVALNSLFGALAKFYIR